MYKFILVIVLISASLVQVIGQVEFPTDLIQKEDGLPAKERAFLEWQTRNNMQGAKGWKWYARWMEENISRADGRGQIADQSPLFEAAIRLSDDKSDIQWRNQNSNWSPVGPSVLPKNLNNRLITGIGRINTIAFHPTDANTFWVGVAQGGVWKTTNSGKSWIPLTDNLPILRISHIAVNPNNPEVMYIAVGDYAYFGVGLDLDSRKRHTHYGLGVYKTINGGKTWNPTGLTFDQTSRDRSLIRRIFISKQNDQNIVAAGIDGMWTSQDAGANWTKVFDGQVADFEQDPSKERVLYMSTAHRNTLNRGIAGIWKSEDFGTTWVELQSGLPKNGNVQRIELAISPSNPEYIYALTANKFGGLYGLYVSKDGGDTWALQSNEPNILHWGDGTRGISGQGFYDLTILVHPDNPDIIYTGGINIWGSKDGGKSWLPISYWVSSLGPSVHADQHFLAYNKLDKKYYLCNDGGVVRTDEMIMQNSWKEILDVKDFKWPTQWENLGNGLQATSFYRLSVSRQNGDIMGGAQDNSTYFRRDGEWFNVVGGDGMECIIDPIDINNIYGSSQYGRIAKSVNRGAQFTSMSANIPVSESGAWTTPFFVREDTPNEIYIGLGNVWYSNDKGVSWTQKSSFDTIRQRGMPGAIGHFSVAPSDPNFIYVAKRIYHSYNEPSRFLRTEDGGVTWQDVTFGLPDSLYFNFVITDENDPSAVWVTMGGFSDGLKVFKSEDAGMNWTNISSNLPNVPVNCIIKDAESKKNTLYVGTDIGVYYFNDDSEEWQLFSHQLPNVIVSELEIHPGKSKIYAATFGRGIWVSDLLDEVTTSNEKGIKNKLEWTVFPNPNNGSFEIKYPSNIIGQFQMEIVNVMGLVVYQNDFLQPPDRSKYALNLPLLSGQYYLRIINGKRSYVTPFIVE